MNQARAEKVCERLMIAMKPVAEKVVELKELGIHSHEAFVHLTDMGEDIYTDLPEDDRREFFSALVGYVTVSRMVELQREPQAHKIAALLAEAMALLVPDKIRIVPEEESEEPV